MIKNVTLENHGHDETAKEPVWLGRGNTCPRAPDKDKGQRTKDNEAKVERSGVVMKVEKQNYNECNFRNPRNNKMKVSDLDAQ